MVLACGEEVDNIGPIYRGHYWLISATSVKYILRFSHSINKHLLSASYILNTVPGNGLTKLKIQSLTQGSYGPGRGPLE